MQVKPSQLEPGCVLLQDVIGKSKHPIIPKRTILTEKHIEILKGFLIKSVDVDKHYVNGDPFIPHPPKEEKEIILVERENELPFEQQFYEAVAAYKKVYKQIRSGMPLDILQVRKLLIPLLERTEEVDRFVKNIHLYGGDKREYIYNHSVSVGILSSFLARKMKLSRAESIQIGLAGLLSDSGMAKIDQTLVLREGLLHKEEMDNQIKIHPTYSYRLVENTNALSHEAKLGILQHHERMDGSGYPLGVNFEKIHKYAQIIAVSDVYHAIVSERLYKEKQPPFKAMEELEKNRILLFNSKIVRQLISTIGHLQVGDQVRLSDGRIGQVIFVDPNQPLRPIVTLEHSEVVIALEHTPNIYIEELL